MVSNKFIQIQLVWILIGITGEWEGSMHLIKFQIKRYGILNTIMSIHSPIETIWVRIFNKHLFDGRPTVDLVWQNVSSMMHFLDIKTPQWQTDRN